MACHLFRTAAGKYYVLQHKEKIIQVFRSGVCFSELGARALALALLPKPELLEAISKDILEMASNSG